MGYGTRSCVGVGGVDVNSSYRSREEVIIEVDGVVLRR